MRDNLSPEEKLLRLIKGQKKIAAKISGDKNPSLAAQLTLRPSLKNFQALNLKELFFSFNRQKIIILAYILGGIYFICALIYPFLALGKISSPQVSAKDAGQIKLDFGEGKKPLEFYQQQISRRSIFSSAKEAAAGAGPASGVNIDLTKDINLVGIISGEPPQAIIEDVKTKKTYYVTKGQFIGEFQVEDIREGKIIINYNGQKYELYI